MTLSSFRTTAMLTLTAGLNFEISFEENHAKIHSFVINVNQLDIRVAYFTGLNDTDQQKKIFFVI